MKNKSVLYTWALDFALLLALMACMCLALTWSARQKLLQEYQEITVLQQEKIETVLMNSLKQVQEQSVELAGNNNVRSFSYLSAPGLPDNYTIYTIKRLLSTTAGGRGAASETYIYFSNVQKAISSETIYEKGALTAQLLGQDDAESRAVLEDMIGTISLNRLVVYPGRDGLRVLLCTSIPALGHTVRAVVIQQLDLKALQEVIESQATLRDTVTLLLDGDGTVICQNGDAGTAQQLAAQYGELDGGSRQWIGEQEYWLRSQPLNLGDWALVTMVPMRTIARKCDWVLRQSLVFLALFLLLGAVISCYLIRRNYEPVQRIVSSLSPEHSAMGGNEYGQISVAFHAALSELENLKLMQEKQRVEMRREWLESVMLYDVAVADRDAAGVLERLGIQPVGEWFVLLAVQGEQGIGDTELPGLLPLPGPGQEIIPVAPHGKPILCLFAQDQPSVEQLAGEVCAVLRQNGLVFLQGATRQGFSQLHLEFLAMYSRMDQEEAAPAGDVRLAQRIILPPSEKVSRLVFSGQGQAACEALAGVAALNFEGKPFSVYLGRLFYTDLLLHLLNAVPENGSCEEVQQAVTGSSRALQKAVSQAEMQELLQTLLLAIASHYRPALKEQQADLLTRIMDCLQAHFTEHNFNVSRMADMLGVSVAYLSKYFKEQTGVNLLGYLNGIRIDYAKKLMVEEKLSVAAAADRAGFENINTFIRLFKKYVGDTPGNFAKH